MNERLNFESHLALAEKKAFQLKYELKSIVKSMRGHLDPLEKVEKLDPEIITQEALTFAKKHSIYMETIEEIKQAKEILGQD